MKDSRINYVVVGGFVSVMIVVFVFIISILAGSTGSTDKYYTVYNNVGGLKYGTQVLYEGYQIGQVDSIEPMFDDDRVQFRINIEVQEGWVIPDDSVARATVSGLLSAMTIDIAGGSSAEPLASGSLIPGVAPSNFFAALSEIGAEFGDLSQNSIKPLIENLNSYVTQIGDAAVDNAGPMLANLKTISEDLNRQVPEISASFTRTAKLVESDVLSEQNRGNLGSILTNFETASSDMAGLARELNETRVLIHESVEQINTVVSDNATGVGDAVQDLRYTLATISRTIDDITGNLEATSRNFAEFSRSIRQNPGLLLGGSPQQDEALANGGR
ncbi:MAG: MCE family protein [Rhodospirillaceae bacterium]|nr:MCE family protein [Rhodospirillaceae bacterium]